ncbi:DUF6524 family protein [Jhaorihella thermophila]|uniref:Uncharacterized protein n=1 Tax=Jhaorihella thermophila TaxID=488547 RepID=A0A1H5XSJ0_9RHOB|nr:hypothetical protein SAMN05421751_11246 [Jhaorihella thermophila]
MLGLFLRWLFAFALIALTYNPTPWNYVRWSTTHHEARLSLVVFLGLLLLIGYIIYLRATLRSIGAGGMLLVLAVVASMLWVLRDYGVLRFDQADVNLWLGIFALSVVLGIGLNWSHARRYLSGQQDMDDVDY